MAATAEKSDPALWEKVKTQVTEGDKGGKAGQWSARKAQLAVHEYQAAGGGYKGEKSADNHLAEWTRKEWGTRSGKDSGETGERYLPEQAREALSDADYKRTTAKKRADTAKGKQFSAQPKDIAAKTAPLRETGHRETGHRETGHHASRADLLQQAARHDIKGRSRMTKAELEGALHAAGKHG